MNRVAFGNGNRVGLVFGLFACIGVACASPDTDDETGGSPTTSNANGGNSQNGGAPPQGSGGADSSAGGAPTTSNNMNTTVAPPTTTDQMGTTVGNPTTTGPGCDEIECLTLCFSTVGSFGMCQGNDCVCDDGQGGGTGSLLDSVGSFVSGQGGSSSSFPSGGFGGAFPAGGLGGDIGFP